MTDMQTQRQQVVVSTMRTFPAAPFPRKYIHSVFNNLEDAMHALLTLLVAGYDAKDIHIMTGHDLIEALEQSQTLISFLCSSDYDVYLNEGKRGRHILAVRLSNYEQIQQVRDLLAPHHAYLMKYIDTWTVAPLIP